MFGYLKGRKLFPCALKEFEFSFQNLDFNKVLLNFFYYCNLSDIILVRFDQNIFVYTYEKILLNIDNTMYTILKILLQYLVYSAMYLVFKASLKK